MTDVDDIRATIRLTGYPSKPMTVVNEFDIEQSNQNMIDKHIKNLLDLVDHLGMTEDEFLEKYFLEELAPELQLIQSEPFNDTYNYKVVNQFRFRPKSMRPDLFPVKESSNGA